MLSNISILITTFLRDEYLFECIRRISRMMPNIQMVVVDDGYPSEEKTAWRLAFREGGHEWATLPFDSGLPAKRNLGAKLCKTKYLLMGCDDFDFGNIDAVLGIQKLRSILDLNPDIDVASGRHCNNPYEGFLEYVPGSHIKETWLKPDGKHDFYQVDLTVNYFMARTEMVREVPWDERMKIGGEHGDWFLELKQRGKKVVWVPGVNISEFQVPNGMHPDYGKYRGRAVQLGHRIFLEKRNIKVYRGFGDN